jgi:hypothetical protein
VDKKRREQLRAAAIALGGMVVGALVGIIVQVGVEATGMLGPSVEALLDEQQGNFEEVHSRLDELRGSTDDPELSRRLDDLAKLIERQDELRQQARSELVAFGNEVATLRNESLAERGFAGGADFWLAVGESASIGDKQHVLGVVRLWQTAADVIFNGEKSRLSVGDLVSSDDCQVFFKQARPREDKRVGFDVTCD